jgi:hypothetical protein
MWVFLRVRTFSRVIFSPLSQTQLQVKSIRIRTKSGQRMGIFQQTMLFRIYVVYCREKHFKFVSDEIYALKGQGYISYFSHVLANVPFLKLPDPYHIT